MMFSFFLFLSNPLVAGRRGKGLNVKIQEKQPKFGSFTAFLHGLFPNFNTCKYRLSTQKQERGKERRQNLQCKAQIYSQPKNQKTIHQPLCNAKRFN